MIKRSILTLLLGSLLTPANATSKTLSEIKASPHSIECYYPRSEQQETPAVLCTVRIHLALPKGAQIWTREEQELSAIPLVGKDEKGNILLGVFREWETCFHSKGDCHIMVYDFYTRPHGNWIAFETNIEVPVTSGIEELKSSPFSIIKQQIVPVAGHEITIHPFPDPDDKNSIVLNVDYRLLPELISLSFTDAKGKTIPSSIVSAHLNEETKHQRETVVLKTKSTTLQLVMKVLKGRHMIKVPLGFKAAIGRNVGTPHK